MDGDDVAEVLLEQRGKVLDLGGRVDGAAGAARGADGDEAVGLRRRLELARLRLPAPLGGVESDEVDGDVIRSWELYGATAGVVLEEGSCLAHTPTIFAAQFLILAVCAVWSVVLRASGSSGFQPSLLP